MMQSGICMYIYIYTHTYIMQVCKQQGTCVVCELELVLKLWHTYMYKCMHTYIGSNVKCHTATGKLVETFQRFLTASGISLLLQPRQRCFIYFASRSMYGQYDEQCGFQTSGIYTNTNACVYTYRSDVTFHM